MDDWILLADTQHHFRCAIKLMHAIVAARKQRLHPDKTFIGRTTSCVDFLGMRFTPAGLTVGQQSITRAAAKLVQLYEQRADTHRLCQYWWRWVSWITSGLDIKVNNELWVDQVIRALQAMEWEQQNLSWLSLPPPCVTHGCALVS